MKQPEDQMATTDQKFVIYEVKSITNPTQNQLDILKSVLGDEKYSLSSTLKSKINYQSVNIVKYTELAGSVISLEFNTDGLKSSVEHSLIIPLNQKDGMARVYNNSLEYMLE